jgi:ABC-type multidrug transport system fused ATPase/permease subunit
MDVVIIGTALSIILTTDGIGAASAGFILAFASTISGQAYLLLARIRNIELDAVSLERTSEYRHLEQEVSWQRLDLPESVSTSEVYREWPRTGSLEIDGLSARYGPEMPDILHQVSFSVQSGQRVGIVGATGSGKSTLAKALFSFVDVTAGRILIDGLGECSRSCIPADETRLTVNPDIADIPLSKVRSELGIIAQDPILLSGTLRLNLDIEGKYTDEQLYDALHQVQLVKKKSLPVSSGVARVEDEAVNTVAPSPASSAATVVFKQDEAISIFNDLDYEISSGGEKSVDHTMTME